MPKTPSPTAESLYLTAAIAGAKVTKAALAAKLNVTPGLVSQWASGYRPVPATKARALAQVLGIADPGRLSPGFASVAGGEPGNVVPLRKPKAGDEPLRPELVIARLENDVDAMRYVVSALISVMVVHRPAEASAAAKTLRKSVPARFRDRGLVHEVASILERAKV